MAEIDNETLRKLLDSALKAQQPAPQPSYPATSHTTRLNAPAREPSPWIGRSLWAAAGLAVVLLMAVVGYRALPMAGDLVGRLFPAPQTTIQVQPTPAPFPPRGSFRGGGGYAQQPALSQAQAAEQAQLAQPEEQRNAAVPVIQQGQAVNDNGEAIVSESQRRQLNQAVDLAVQEGNSAALQVSAEYVEQRRAAESAAPVVLSAEQIAEKYGRDPCSVPRADPKTCGLGVPAATPLNTP
jgi:hypothetical protein